ncbi:hypothetical protein [Robertmurraya siralis]|uniref:hypothetical protein n=1 Tax=Robertmurraya siralis TaxID=77777 RepID=UPI0010F7579D|nr:hypothetical protein [Robertmurraya siralis]
MSYSESRETYVERELNNWKENYIVRPEQEFLLKSMFELQHQYKITPDEHVKAKRDLIYTIQDVMRSLKLVPVLNKDRFKVLVVVDSDYEKVRVYEMFQKMFADKILLDEINATVNRTHSPKINTKDFEIRIEKDNKNLFRGGMKVDYILNLSGKKCINY